MLPDTERLRDAALAHLLDRAAEAIAARAVFCLALSGGGTPRELYRALASAPADLARWQLFFADERCVPPDHADSNFRLVQETWLERAAGRPAAVHRLRGELEPGQAAREYERELRAALGDPPRFDLVLLGLGTDGHTASLFPGSPALSEREHLVAAADGPPPRRRRLTLTPAALHQARELVFLVSGRSKARALREALAPRPESFPSPARAVAAGAARVLWLVDTAAATELAQAG